MGAVLGQTEDKLTPARIEAAIEWLKDLKTYKGITDVDELETALAVLNVILAESLSEEILLKMEMEARLKWGWVTVNGAGSTIVQPGK